MLKTLRLYDFKTLRLKTKEETLSRLRCFTFTTGTLSTESAHTFLEFYCAMQILKYVDYSLMYHAAQYFLL